MPYRPIAPRRERWSERPGQTDCEVLLGIPAHRAFDEGVTLGTGADRLRGPLRHSNQSRMRRAIEWDRGSTDCEILIGAQPPGATDRGAVDWKKWRSAVCFREQAAVPYFYGNASGTPPPYLVFGKYLILFTL